MISMTYDLAKISMTALLEPACRAGIELARLDERVARSPVGEGWIERSQYADACASLWIDGELVHLEDLVLHDATRDIRTPTHELTIARDVLRTRRRIAGQSPDWALSAEGIRTLRKAAEIGLGGADEATAAGVNRPAVVIDAEGEGDDLDAIENLPGVDYAAIDAVLARSNAAIENATRPDCKTSGRGVEKDPMILSTEIAILATNKLFELAGTRSTLAEHGLDRHWRNARTHTLHDPVRWKYAILSKYFLNGENPPLHAWS